MPVGGLHPTHWKTKYSILQEEEEEEVQLFIDWTSGKGKK